MPEFKEFIRIIGRGQRAGRALSQEEAYQAMHMLISGAVTAEQKGAFLMLLRVREETPEELAGFLQAFRQHSCAPLSNMQIDVDMGCYAGKRRHLPWFLLAAMTLAQTDKRIFLHGTHEPDSNRLYLHQVLPSLGIEVCQTATQIKSQLDNTGFAYADLSSVNQPLFDMIQLRSLFGLRSCANTLARMLNPSNALFSLQGVFHRDVDEKHRLCAALLHEANVLCFRGEGGELEYNPERDVTLHLNRLDQQHCIQVPAMTDRRALKSKLLDPVNLMAVWSGSLQDDYADMAVVGTLAIMLVLTESLEWQTAVDKSQQLWYQRSKPTVSTATSLQVTASFNTEHAKTPH